MRKLLLSAIVAFGFSGLGAYADTNAQTPAQPTTDVVDTLKDKGGFDTFLAAADVAELTETLKSEGPFTVFVPTDEAFAALPEGKLDELMQNKEMLRDVLLYHVVPGELLSADVIAQSELTTVSGKTLPIEVRQDGTYIQKAKITAVDIMATNGVIHVIDSVLMQP